MSEAIEESTNNQLLVFSDHEDEITNDEIDFVDDSEQQREGVRFYRKLDPENVEHYYKFPNQTRNPKEAVYKYDELFFGTEGMQPELHDPENRYFVSFDKFAGFKKSVQKFKKTLKNFDDSENSLFDARIYNQVQNILEQSRFTPSPNSNVVFALN